MYPLLFHIRSPGCSSVLTRILQYNGRVKTFVFETVQVQGESERTDDTFISNWGLQERAVVINL